MKSITYIITSILFISLLFACSGASEEGTANAEPAAISCADLSTQYDESQGKEITIKAISWGTSNTVSGDVYLNLGDEALSGFKQAKVVAVFGAEKEEIAKALSKDSQVTLKATVGESKHGAIYLTNPVVL